MSTSKKSLKENPKNILKRILQLKLKHPYHPTIKKLQVLYDMMVSKKPKA